MLASLLDNIRNRFAIAKATWPFNRKLQDLLVSSKSKPNQITEEDKKRTRDLLTKLATLTPPQFDTWLKKARHELTTEEIFGQVIPFFTGAFDFIGEHPKQIRDSIRQGVLDLITEKENLWHKVKDFHGGAEMYPFQQVIQCLHNSSQEGRQWVTNYFDGLFAKTRETNNPAMQKLVAALEI